MPLCVFFFDTLFVVLLLTQKSVNDNHKGFLATSTVLAVVLVASHSPTIYFYSSRLLCIVCFPLSWCSFYHSYGGE